MPLLCRQAIAIDLRRVRPESDLSGDDGLGREAGTNQFPADDARRDEHRGRQHRDGHGDLRHDQRRPGGTQSCAAAAVQLVQVRGQADRRSPSARAPRR